MAVADRPGHHSIDEYLVVIHGLLFPVGEYRPGDAAAPIAARVADRLSISRAAVGEMLKRLTDQQLVRRGARREIVLTPAGIARAEQAIRRQRIAERFLTDYLGYEPAEVRAHAARLSAAMPDDMLEAIHARLGYPERCPHGWPMHPEQANDELRALRPLADLAIGELAEIACANEEDAALLRWLSAEGLTPGTTIEVQEVQPAAGHVKVRVGDGADRVVADRAARQLYVRKAGRTRRAEPKRSARSR